MKYDYWKELSKKIVDLVEERFNSAEIARLAEEGLLEGEIKSILREIPKFKNIMESQNYLIFELGESIDDAVIILEDRHIVEHAVFTKDAIKQEVKAIGEEITKRFSGDKKDFKKWVKKYIHEDFRLVFRSEGTILHCKEVRFEEFDSCIVGIVGMQARQRRPQEIIAVSVYRLQDEIVKELSDIVYSVYEKNK